MNVQGEIIFNDGQRWQINAELFYDKSPYGIGSWWGSFVTVNTEEDELQRMFAVYSNTLPVTFCLQLNSRFFRGESLITGVDPQDRCYPFRGNGLLEESADCSSGSKQ